MSISDIKYKYLGYQYDIIIYLFDNEVDYALIYYFVESKITKDNIDKFLSNPLMKSIMK